MKVVWFETTSVRFLANLTVEEKYEDNQLSALKSKALS